MKYTQAKWEHDKEDLYEPLLSEKDGNEVEIESSLPDELTRDTSICPNFPNPNWPATTPG